MTTISFTPANVSSYTNQPLTTISGQPVSIERKDNAYQIKVSNRQIIGNQKEAPHILNLLQVGTIQ